MLRALCSSDHVLSLCNNQVVLSELVRALRSSSVSKIRLLSEQIRALRWRSVSESSSLCNDQVMLSERAW
ncbi:hypothetical protein ACN42_g5753 [Penicillium freii]|uniref:Uncharacterized protein n=1 Tax=Penicillium freii TaxID=48697 RepID=A0A101MIS1_PENFR|nr:hypothetical protein ACN42_g5753 [Penicillium freii]